MRLPAGNGGPVHFALAPRGIWCAGTLVVRVRATRAGSPTGVTRLRVRSPEALGAGNVVGHLLLGPTCPVEREDDPCDPVARPQPVTIVAFDELGIEAGRTQTLGDGSFALELPAGRFRLHGEVPGGSPPRIGDATISVSPSATREHPLRATVSGDTGIR